MPSGRAVAFGTLLALSCPGVAHGACTASTSAVNFGAYDPRAAVADPAAGQINVNCTGEGWLFGASVRMSRGASGTYFSRAMASGARRLNYNLYSDTARTQVWGDGSGGTVTVTVPVILGRGSRAVYGQIPPLQNVAAGTYQDTIVVTVEY